MRVASRVGRKDLYDGITERKRRALHLNDRGFIRPKSSVFWQHGHLPRHLGFDKSTCASPLRRKPDFHVL